MSIAVNTIMQTASRIRTESRAWVTTAGALARFSPNSLENVPDRARKKAAISSSPVAKPIVAKSGELTTILAAVLTL